MVADDFNGVPVGGAGMDLISNATVHLKKRSKTQKLPVPHALTFCGGPEWFQVNGLTYVGLSSRGHNRNGPFGNTSRLR